MWGLLKTDSLVTRRTTPQAGQQVCQPIGWACALHAAHLAGGRQHAGVSCYTGQSLPCQGWDMHPSQAVGASGACVEQGYGYALPVCCLHQPEG